MMYLLTLIFYSLQFFIIEADSFIFMCAVPVQIKTGKG